MWAASGGTLTDQVAGSASAEVAVNASAPTVTVTVTPPSEPVSPEIVNPASFSAMLTVSSPAMMPRFSARVPADSTVIVKVAVASLYSSLDAAVAVITHSPGPAIVNAPVDELTVHTPSGVAE